MSSSQPTFFRNRLRRSAAPLLLALAAVFSPLSAMAVVDDSHSAAMEAAVDAVKQGFKIRQEYWKGTLKSGEKKAVKQQLFKGNEYWFFLGTNSENVTLSIDVYDNKGVKVTVESKIDPDSGAVRVLAPKTGTYTVVFSLTGKENEEISWALAYGYR